MLSRPLAANGVAAADFDDARANRPLMAPTIDEPATSLTAAEERVKALEQQLARTQRLAALGELTSTTTHEFNNVLMTILNYARMGQRHKDGATRDKALEKILAAAQRASK